LGAGHSKRKRREKEKVTGEEKARSVSLVAEESTKGWSFWGEGGERLLGREDSWRAPPAGSGRKGSGLGLRKETRRCLEGNDGQGNALGTWRGREKGMNPAK
jgi:hypothetical protein